MTYTVKFTSAFKRGYKLMARRGYDMALLDKVIDTIRRGERLGEKYRDHELTGKYRGFRECHVKPDWLLIYIIEDDVLVLTLTETGTHADLFGI